MSNFSESATGFRLLIAHPVPWAYKSNYSPGKAAILDNDGKVVVVEGQVSNVLFDGIWALYFDLLRPDEEE